ncbi:hypothetical protein [Streptomyces rishiriensis]|uniref:hypothetical protein n=1 Tax=Streptomyces rishiriensis TaxID=68264 RepID=UPI0027D92D6D|nr:hypothetical protein [Streptomyces rishiriensis]
MTTRDSEDIDNENTADGGRGDPAYGDPGHGDPPYRDPGHGDPGYAHPGCGDLGSGVMGSGVMGEVSETKGADGARSARSARFTRVTRFTRFTSTHRRVLVAASGWSALAVTALPGPSPVRWIPVLLFVLFGPGCAALHPQPGRLASGARLEAIALAAPISLSLGVLTATSLFLVEAFSTTAFLVSLACFTTVTAALPGLPLPAARRGAVERARVRRRPSGGSDT